MLTSPYLYVCYVQLFYKPVCTKTAIAARTCMKAHCGGWSIHSLLELSHTLESWISSIHRMVCLNYAEEVLQHWIRYITPAYRRLRQNIAQAKDVGTHAHCLRQLVKTKSTSTVADKYRLQLCRSCGEANQIEGTRPSLAIMQVGVLTAWPMDDLEPLMHRIWDLSNEKLSIHRTTFIVYSWGGPYVVLSTRTRCV